MTISSEDRSCVREACKALDKFNKMVEECSRRGIKVRLELHGCKFLAEFTRTENILPT
jgi:hypothetical protein